MNTKYLSVLSAVILSLALCLSVVSAEYDWNTDFSYVDNMISENADGSFAALNKIVSLENDDFASINRAIAIAGDDFASTLSLINLNEELFTSLNQIIALDDDSFVTRNTALSVDIWPFTSLWI